MSIFARLGYNFDSKKFDGAEVLSEGTIEYLDAQPNTLEDWQVDDLANATTNTDTYYQNPHSNVLSFIKTTLSSMITTIDTTSYNDPTANADVLVLASLANTTINVLGDFYNHTNNISGLSVSENTANTPDLDSAISVGRQLLEITYKNDGVQNNVPMLGSFTSLYIGDDIENSNTILYADLPLLSNSDISAASVNNISLHVQTFYNLIDERRIADMNFYANSVIIIEEYNNITKFNALGETQNSLIKLIGTDKLKTDLGIK